MRNDSRSVSTTTLWCGSRSRRLRAAGTVRVSTPRKPRLATYDSNVVAALAVVWRFMRCPAGKRLAAMLPLVVPMLRRDGDLVLADEVATLPRALSPASIHRKLAGERLALGRGELFRPLVLAGFGMLSCNSGTTSDPVHSCWSGVPSGSPGWLPSQ